MGQTQINPQISYSLYANLFSYENAPPQLLSLDRKWSQVWQLTNVLNNNKSQPTSSKDGSYIRPIRRRQSVKQQILTNTQSGLNLVLTWADPNYNAFRVKDVIKDNALNEGRVILSQPGQVTIEPFFNPAVLTAGTHFVVGGFAYTYYDASGNYSSVGKDNLFLESVPQTDYVSVQRDSLTLSRREKFNTHVGTDGNFYLWHQDEKDMIARAFMNYGKKIMFSELGAPKSTQVEGLVSSTRGIRPSIIADGYYQAGSAPIIQAFFEAGLMAVSQSTGTFEQEITAMVGRRALSTISSFYLNQLTYSGASVRAKSIGGHDISGITLDVREVTFAGIKVKLIPLELLNDTINVPDWMQDSVYIIQTAPIESVNNMGSVSPIQKIHWSSNGTQDDEVIYKCVAGMTGHHNDNFTSQADAAGYQFTSSTVDGMSCQVLFDNGISCIADNWYLYEWIR